MARVLVTGAKGYIGQPLVAQLETSGHQVFKLVRRGDANDQSTVIQDILADTDWQKLLVNIDAVVHLADDSRQLEAMKNAPSGLVENIQEKTRHLAESAAKSGVTKFIYMSSIKAVSNEWNPEILTENALPPKKHSIYGEFKWGVEQGLTALGQQTGMQVVVLRPPLVYGPAAGGNFQKLLKLASLPYPLPFAGFDAKRSMIALTNLCDAVDTVLQNEKELSGIYFVCDKETLSIADVLRIVKKLNRQSGRVFHLPGLKLLSHLPAGRTLMDRLARPLMISGALFEREFNWKPPLSAREGLVIATGQVEASPNEHRLAQENNPV